MIATAGLGDNVLVSDANTGEIMVKLAGQGCQTVNSVVFSKSDTKIATASDVGRVVFWPVAPFSTQETLDVLRSHPGARPNASYLKKLHLLNTWSDVYLPGERRGYTFLHVLAETCVNGNYWGEGYGHDDYYEQLLDEWSLSNIPYAPVLNNAGQTPLELAILTRNHSFFDHLCEKKGLLDMLPNFKGTDGDEEARHNSITVRDLDVMLDWSTSRRAVVKYLQQPALLVPVDHTLFNCHT
jgi:hypothetical protein